MRVRPEQVERYGMLVWENGTAEAVRKEECLCLHCDSMRPGSQEHCPIAQQFYEICKTHGTALGLSRCAVWKEKPGETYHPIALATTHLDIQAAPLNADALSRPILITRLLVPQSNPQLPYQAPTIDCADVCRSL